MARPRKHEGDTVTLSARVPRELKEAFDGYVAQLNAKLPYGSVTASEALVMLVKEAVGQGSITARPAASQEVAQRVAELDVREIDLAKRVARLEGQGSGEPITARSVAKTTTPKTERKAERNPAWFHQPKGERLNAAGKEELYRRLDAREKPSDIAKAMCLSISRVNQVRKEREQSQ